MRRRLFIVAAMIAALAALTDLARAQPALAPDLGAPELRRGVNFGNMLEAPREGEWGLTVKPEYFRLAREGGFDHVRLPVSWTHHALPDAPYTIDPAFLDRVDWCVEQALANGLSIIVNDHHHDELNADPERESARALAIWEQVALRLRARPASVLFEVLNEPHGAFNDQPKLWNDHLAQALGVIRRTNPSRWVLAGPVRWNSISALDGFSPPADRRLLITVHTYDPFAFTHQGAEWIDPPPPVGLPWDPKFRGLAWPWDNWSWRTTLTPGPDGLVVEHLAGWAGASFHRASPWRGAKAIEFRIDHALDLRVIATLGSEERAEVVHARAGDNRFELPADFGVIDRVSLQNASDEPAPAYTLSMLRVVADSGSEPVIRGADETIDAALSRAASWARERGRPIHVGEFGAYSKADLASRVAWTRSVRTAAERHGMPWTYWEFGAGFGIYDPRERRWRTPLLHALTRE